MCKSARQWDQSLEDFVEKYCHMHHIGVTLAEGSGAMGGNDQSQEMGKECDGVC